MDPHPTRSRFDTTNWSLVLRAQASPEDLGRLLRVYWSPVYAFIRRSGHRPEDAADLTQQFLTQVVLGRELVGRADPARGRFRTFLKAALRNFLIDCARTERARIRTVALTFLPADPASIAAAEPPATDAPADTFDRFWASSTMAAALERLEAVCRRDGMEGQWNAFAANVVAPAVHGHRPIPLDELAARVGAASPQQVSSMLQTVKRRFKRILRAVIAETVDDPTHVDDELAAISRFLA